MGEGARENGRTEKREEDREKRSRRVDLPTRLPACLPACPPASESHRRCSGASDFHVALRDNIAALFYPRPLRENFGMVRRHVSCRWLERQLSGRGWTIGTRSRPSVEKKKFFSLRFTSIMSTAFDGRGDARERRAGRSGR